MEGRPDTGAHSSLATFRTRVLSALARLRNERPGAALCLLYAPDHDDALGWTDAGARETALIHWGRDLGYAAPQWPRLIAMDCRRIAAWMLETDPALDDPWLEVSIVHAHHYTCPHVMLSATVGRPMAGWLICTEPLQQVASRLSRASRAHDPQRGESRWLRWHDPRVLALLWPLLTPAQRVGLLGPGTAWLGVDGVGELIEFEAPAESNPEASALPLTAQQWSRVARVGLLNHLLAQWHLGMYERGRPLPEGAAQRMLNVVAAPETQHLDGHDLEVYALAAVSVSPAATTDPAWQSMLKSTQGRPGQLAAALDTLPAAFWRQYAFS